MLHRGQESTDGAGGGELSVPMAWFYAEYIAEELLRTGDLMPPKKSKEQPTDEERLAMVRALREGTAALRGKLEIP